MEKYTLFSDIGNLFFLETSGIQKPNCITRLVTEKVIPWQNSIMKPVDMCVCAVVAGCPDKGKCAGVWEGFIITVTRWSHCSNSCAMLQGALFLKHNRITLAE